MPQTEIGRLLEELEGQMSAGGQIGESDRAALRELQARIAAVLTGEDADDVGTEQVAAEPIADYIDRFESSHPTLTMTLGRIMDALNKLGI